MRVAVLQMKCQDNGDKAANADTFRRLVHEACSNDNNSQQPVRVSLVLGPEFAIGGYTYDYETMWKTAECQGGQTEQLLCQLGEKYGVYIGVSYLEATANSTDNGECHFFNTFALASPAGKIVGRVRKMTPCSVEAYYFTAPPPPNQTTSSPAFPHVLECVDETTGQVALRIGVLICYENFVYESLRELQQSQEPLDLLLQPFSGPLADNQNEYVKEKLRQMYHDVCSQNARYLNCPALYCNKVGAWKQPSPCKFMPMTLDTEFPGGSVICDHTGQEVVPRLDHETVGVLVGEVVLGRDLSPNTQQRPLIPRYWGGYTDPTPFLKLCRLYEWLGSRSYHHDPLRQQLAREAVERHNNKRPPSPHRHDDN